MSPRWNWDSPTPLAASECALPPGPKGGGHTREFSEHEQKTALSLYFRADFNNSPTILTRIVSRFRIYIQTHRYGFVRKFSSN